MMLFAGLGRRFRAWSRRHSYSFFSSLGALLQHRVGTLMTVAVLGVAILLPTGLWVTLKNLDRMDLQREEWGAITVFLAAGATEAEARDLAARVQERDEVDAITLVSPEQAMAEFMETSGFGHALDLFDANPLPWVLVVSPADKAIIGEYVEQTVTGLMTFLRSQSRVDSVQYDYKWLQRLGRLLELGRALVMVLSILFGVAVVVVVANTIRLDVAARSEEIEILALVGAGNGFIRQPFLYSGFWYGLMGGLLAYLLLQLTLFYLGGPLGRLLETYGQDLKLIGLDPSQAVLLLGGSGLLGLCGALVSVQRYLRMLAIGGGLGRR
jgi:cell division transport system permease protein